MTGSVKPRCHLPWQQMVIDSPGNVAPCCYWGAYDNRNAPIGNINQNSIEEIWNNERFQQLRRGMATNDLASAGCSACYALKQGLDLSLEYDAACEDEGSVRTEYGKNLEILKQEIAEGAAVLRAKPTMISYTPSHRCNIRCTHCYQESTRNEEIAGGRAREEILGFSPYLVRLIAGGGEPFLLPIWREFLTHFDLSTNPYLDFATTTNATILSEDILSGLSRFKRLTMNVSLDGTDAAYERVRVGAKFSQVRDNIRKLKAVVSNSKSSKSTLGVSMCVMKSNILDLPNFIRFCTKEELRYGLSPVISMPPDESLRCFNDPNSEIQGWSDAISKGQELLEDYFPVLARLRGESEVSPDFKALWRKDFDVLRSTIPFDLARVRHHRVRVVLPDDLIEQYSSANRDQALVAYIFKIGDADRNAPYWAPIKGREIEVSLPQGMYCVNVSTKWVNAGYQEGLSFSVTQDNERPIEAKYRAAVLRRMKGTVKRLLGPRIVRIGQAALGRTPSA